MRFRKKPVVIEAVQYDGSNITELWDFAGADKVYGPTEVNSLPFVMTLEGNMTISVGDFLIKGVKGEFYPCKPDIFEQTYEAVE